MARTPTGWHREDIKAELRKTCGAITTLSASWGMNRNAITQALRRPDYSVKVEKLIAEALDVPLHELWPARWAKDGKALPRSNNFDPIPQPTRPNSQNARAA